MIKFWEHLSDAFLGNLRGLAEKEGLKGCFEYWSHTLTEEAADFMMTLDEERGEFVIEMRHCPSAGRLLETEHIEPYEYYCEHCDTLYRRILEPLGFSYEVDLTQCQEAKCCLRVMAKKKV